jgi:hypothetical protein
MVIGKDFVWAHFAKNGGDSIYDLFDLFPELVIKKSSKRDPLKHTTFKNTPGIEHIQYRVMNIRRLPAYWLSRCFHGFLFEKVDFRRKDILNGIINWEDGTMMRLDEHFSHYEPHKVDRWFRTEFINQDFIEFIKDFNGNLNGINHLTSNPPPKKNSLFPIPLYENVFTKDEMKMMYNSCPLWAEYEHKAFGNLLI